MMENPNFELPPDKEHLQKDGLTEKIKKVAGKAAAIGAIAATLASEGCGPNGEKSTDNKKANENAEFLNAAKEVLQQTKEASEKSYPHLIKSYHQFVKDGKLPLQGMLAVTPEAVARAREMCLEARYLVGNKPIEVIEVRGYVPTRIKVGGIELHSVVSHSWQEKEMIKGVERALGIHTDELKSGTLEKSTNSVKNMNFKKDGSVKNRPFVSGGDDF